MDFDDKNRTRRYRSAKYHTENWDNGDTNPDSRQLHDSYQRETTTDDFSSQSSYRRTRHSYDDQPDNRRKPDHKDTDPYDAGFSTDTEYSEKTYRRVRESSPDYESSYQSARNRSSRSESYGSSRNMERSSSSSGQRNRSNRPKKKKSRSPKWLGLIIGIVIVIVVIFAGINIYQRTFNMAKGLVAENEAQTTENTAGTGETVSITIPEGASTKDIADILKENGLIGSTLVFRFKSKAGNFDGTYRHGTYTIEKGLEDEQIMELLQHGAVDASQIKITIPEGYTVKQIGALLEENGVTTADAFLEAVNSRDYNFDFIQQIPDRDPLLEGYLFPDTYYFNEDTPATDVVNRMLTRFSEVYTDALAQDVADGYTMDDIIIMASIIEAEIQVPEERAMASSVIYNRLEQDMPLQMCSTVLYALGIRRDALTLEDLEVDSPYNTYLYSGLPIGPICNPGAAAIDAAIHPDGSDYLYFVLKAEEQGAHEFTNNYEDFLAAKERYQQQF